MRDHMFAADLTELARNDGGWAQLRQVRCNVFARYLSDFAAIRTRHQEARTLVVVIL